MINVSIVEDDRAVRELLADCIGRAEGFHCLSQYADAGSAMGQLPADNPGVVLMDINLPDATGIECVRQLKPLMPETHFLMLTVYEDSHHIFDALESGAVGYLLKPTPGDKLIASLRQICDGGAPMTSYIARKVVESFRQTPPPSAATQTLSARENEVLGLLARGYYHKEIADQLGVKITTVTTYVSRIYEKLHVHSRARAVAKLNGIRDSHRPAK